MNRDDLLGILDAVRAGTTPVDEALRRLAGLEDARMGFATIDGRRAARVGHPEVVYGPGKRPHELVAIAKRLVETSGTFLATRLDERGIEALDRTFAGETEVNESCGAVVVDRRPEVEPVGSVVVVSAGTSDGAVAAEAALTCRWCRSATTVVADVGVAGVHRILAHDETLRAANALVVVAGMDGALPSVVGGLYDIPLVACPTSVGYGASFGGVAALLGMLSSCAPGVTVVNIDNGFGAGYAASRINRAVAAATGTSGGEDRTATDVAPAHRT